MKSTGGCLCGEFRYTYDGEPELQLICHCTNCQKQSGSAFASILLVKVADLTTSGQLSSRGNLADSGNTLYRQFCPSCGSPVLIKSAARDDTIMINAGTLDDTAQFNPQMHIWDKSKQPWLQLGDDLQCFADNPVLEAKPE